MNVTAGIGDLKQLLGTARTFLLTSLLLLLVIAPVRGNDAQLPNLSAAETLRLGERIYREGILPSGEQLKGTLKGDVTIPGNAFSCQNCHLRSGIGSIEGQIVTPPTTGLKLYDYYYKYELILGDHSRVKKGMWDGRAPAKPVFRPAYTDETLANALRLGVSPTGREFNSAMPRFELKESDLKVLIRYLKSLSSEISPGVDKDFKYIRFATVIAGDVPADERTEMLATLDGVIDQHNNNARKKNRFQNDGTQMKGAYFNYPAFI